MPGRPPKPRPPSADRARLIGQVLSDVGNFRAKSAREGMEEKLGRPLTDNEWLAIGMAGRASAESGSGT